MWIAGHEQVGKISHFEIEQHSIEYSTVASTKIYKFKAIKDGEHHLIMIYLSFVLEKKYIFTMKEEEKVQNS